VSAFKSKKRYLRLLPGVVLVCAALLLLKLSGLIHDAFALETGPQSSDAMAPGPKPANADFAGDTTEVSSASEVDVLTSLSKRRAELDSRERQIQSQADMLAATESRVDAKIAQLKDLQSQIASLLTQRDAEQQKQITDLVKTYSSMGKKAAPIFNNLPDEVLVPVAQNMKPDDLALIMANMSPDAAQKLTVKLASRLALPATTPVAAPAPAPVPPGPAAPAAAAKAANPSATPKG
jgi:flagellar motility protein MotE (MotC chaperone)